MARIIIPGARTVSPARGLILPDGLKGRASIRGDGTDDSIIGTFPADLAGQKPLTMAGWFRPSGTGAAGSRIPFSVGKTVAGSQIAYIQSALSGTRRLWGCGTWDYSETFATLPSEVGRWVPVVLRHSGVAASKLRLSVGGTMVTGTTNVTPNWTAGYCSIFEESRAVAVYDWGGNAYDCRVYNRDWSDAEVEAFGRGELIDSAGLLRRWTCEAPGYGTTCTEEIGKTADVMTGAVYDPSVPFRRRRVVEDVAACVKGDGVNTTVANHADLNPGAGDFGVMGWFNIRQLATAVRIFEKGLAAPYWLCYHNATRQLVFLVNDGVDAASATTRVLSGPTGWIHLACVRDNTLNALRLHVNAFPYLSGSLAAVGALDNASNLIFASVAGTAHQDYGDWLWRKGAPFTWDEVEAHYYDGIEPTAPAGSVQIAWGMREGAGTAVASRPSGYNGTLSAASWTTSTRCHARTAA